MADLDPRLLRVSITVRGQTNSYENIAITASGTKYSNATQGECNITIANLRKDVTDYILSETSPFNRNRTNIPIMVEAGRVSTGFSIVYTGNIFRSSISQPPDSIMSLRCITLQFEKGNIVTRSQPPQSSLSEIARGIAEDLGLPLSFDAEDKQVSNYSFTGAVTKQLEKLEEMAVVDVFTDAGQMFVKPRGKTVAGRVKRVNVNTGMVGVPTLTETGARITILYDAQTSIGGSIELESLQYPGASGNYEIYKMDYNLTNREVPFYNVADCRRIG